jgi:hypothetical protein
MFIIRVEKYILYTLHVILNDIFSKHTLLCPNSFEINPNPYNPYRQTGGHGGVCWSDTIFRNVQFNAKMFETKLLTLATSDLEGIA